MKLKANKELKEKRLNICKNCSYSETNKTVGLTCGKFLYPTYDNQGNPLTCGCKLSWKTSLFSQSCPQKKW